MNTPETAAPVIETMFLERNFDCGPCDNCHPNMEIAELKIKTVDGHDAFALYEGCLDVPRDACYSVNANSRFRTWDLGKNYECFYRLADAVHSPYYAIYRQLLGAAKIERQNRQ